MSILVALVGVIAFLLADYVADAFPVITIVGQQLHSRIIFMALFFSVPLIIIALLEKYKGK